MTLLQRAPREVYRVFDEEEFLARVAHEPRTEPAAAAAAGRRLRRIGGATVLLAATGAVGGLLAMAGVLSASGTRRRAGVRRLASTASSGALQWPTAHVGGARVVRDRTISSGSRDLGEHPQTNHARVSRPPRSALRSLVKHRPAVVLSASRSMSVAVVSEQRSTPSEVAPSRSNRPATVGASQPRRSGRSEFGFER